MDFPAYTKCAEEGTEKNAIAVFHPLPEVPYYAVGDGQILNYLRHV